jgi:phage terminase Nu1 subunit (DNA packaging protein)
MSGHAAQVIAFPTRRRDGVQWEPWVAEAVVARHLGVSTRTVRRWRKEGMPSKLFRGSRRFRLSEIEHWDAERSAS